VIGFLLGKNDFANMAHCLKKEFTNLQKFIPLKNGIPSHDTFSRVMRIVDPEELIFSICDWFGCLIPVNGSHLSIDGKGILAAAKKNRLENTPYIINVLETATKMVLMQLKVGDKTNEITTIPELLKYIDLNGATVTIDAIGTQKEIVSEILAKGGSFVLPVKENQPTLYTEVSLYMNDLIEDNNSAVQCYQDNCSDHGRIEVRKYYLIKDNSCITNKAFQRVNSIGKVWRKRSAIVYDAEGNVAKGTESIQSVYYISDRVLEVEEFACLVRDHWKVEDSLHWVLDNTFREDRSTSRKGYAVENISLMRKVAYNIIRIHEQKMPGQSIEYLIDELRYDLPAMMNYLCASI